MVDWTPLGSTRGNVHLVHAGLINRIPLIHQATLHRRKNRFDGDLYVLLRAAVGVLDGLLFGFDTAVISGTTQALRGTIGSGAHWAPNALLSAVFPIAALQSHATPIVLFAAMRALQFVVVLVGFPETTGVSPRRPPEAPGKCIAGSAALHLVSGGTG